MIDGATITRPTADHLHVHLPNGWTVSLRNDHGSVEVFGWHNVTRERFRDVTRNVTPVRAMAIIRSTASAF